LRLWRRRPFGLPSPADDQVCAVAAGDGHDREGVPLGPGDVGVDGDDALFPDRDGFVPLGGLGPKS